MIGGLLSNTSRLALVVAAGLFMGGVAMPSAKAADLGGDCCADLEERVAELEATTARKGNRKMSLTITGQVHRLVLWFDDGHTSNTYYGLDSTNASSRFTFNGSAKVTPKVTMGFEIMLEIEAGGTSSKASQFDEDGKLATFVPAGSPSFNGSADAYFGDARRVAWWVEHNDLGRITAGRWEGAMVYATIDLTGHVLLPASPAFGLLNGSMFIRGPTGQFYAMQWSSISDPAAAASNRTELVRYDSPVWNGFIFASQIAEAGDYWGTQIRYASEFSGFRLAGAVGYDRVTDVATPLVITPADPAFIGRKPDVTVWGIALSAMHVPTGLFVQGHYNAADFGGSVIGAPSAWWGESTTHKKDVAHWMIQAGISKNWFGPGITSVYGEYGVATDWGADITCGIASATCTSTAGRNYTTAGFTAVNGVTDTELKMWGLGVVQISTLLPRTSTSAIATWMRTLRARVRGPSIAPVPLVDRPRSCRPRLST